jgi:hypothetical protein
VALYLTAFLIPLEYPDRFAFEVSTIMGSVFLLSTVLQPGLWFRRIPWAVGAFALYICVQLLALIHGEGYPGGLLGSGDQDFAPAAAVDSVFLVLFKSVPPGARLADDSLVAGPRLYDPGRPAVVGRRPDRIRRGNWGNWG